MEGVLVTLRRSSSGFVLAALLAGPAAAAVAPVASAAQSSPTTIQVVLSNDGCAPSSARAVAGPLTFEVRNVGGDRVTEVELMRGDLIIGEKEHLAPGLSGSFAVTVTPGEYQLYCPGAAAEYTPFAVSASTLASPAVDPALRDAFATATAAYQVYVRGEVAGLVGDTRAFAAAVEAGNLDQARALYAPARVHYERIEPVAESFGELDPLIDMREDDADEHTPFTGFHRLERAIWQDGRLDGTAPIAQQLVADVLQLQQLVDDPVAFDFEAARIANGSTELLDEVANSKISGEEERYSRLDLLDMAANVDGARVGFQLLQPGLTQLDPALASTISTRFATLDGAMAPFNDAGVWRTYDQLSPRDVRTLSGAVNDLAEALSQVAARVVVASGGSSGTPNP
jgi:iron uptake system component EfeO